MGAESAAQRTIGVAIKIPSPWHEELVAARREAADPAAELVPPHITLLPPTPILDDSYAVVIRHLTAAARRRRPFQLVLRGTGTFRPVTDVVFVTVAAGISDCEIIQEDIRTGPLIRELQFPYHPHVTIAHDVAPAALDAAFEQLAGFEARFTVDSFTLYRHHDDASWRPAQDFVLGA